MAASIDPTETVRGLHRGPLVQYVRTYIARARSEGYPPNTVLVHVRLLASFNQYLWRRHRGVRYVNEDVVARFVRRDARARLSPGPSVTLRRLLAILRESKAVPPASPLPPPRRTPAQQLADDFRTYLKKDRGLSDAATYAYSLSIDSFLRRRFGAGRLSFVDLTGCDVTDFLRWEIRRRRLHHTDGLLAGMRAFLRFLHYRGLLKIDLSSVVPRPAKWSLAGLPKHFPPGAAEKVLAACDQTVIDAA